MCQLFLPDEEILLLLRLKNKQSIRARHFQNYLHVLLVKSCFNTHLLKVKDALYLFIFLVITLTLVVKEHSIPEDKVPTLPHLMKTGTPFTQNALMKVFRRQMVIHN